MPHTKPHTPSIIMMISGWAGAGKDCAAALLTEECGFHRFAFADALKHEVAATTGVPLDYFYTGQKDRLLPAPCYRYPDAKTPRDLLIQHALVRRAADPDVYARAVATAIAESHERRVVISDWRYRREYEVLAAELRHQIFRVRIERPGVTQGHDPSEHDLDGTAIDYTIHNNGTISDLRHAVKQFYHMALAAAKGDTGGTE